MTKKVIRKYYRDGIEYRIKFPKLPSAYQEVEWIESSGTQYISSLDYKPNNNTKIQLKYICTHYDWDILIWKDNWRLFNFVGTSSTYPRWTYFDVSSSQRIIWLHTQSTSDIYEIEIWNFYIKNLATWTNVATWTTQWSYSTSDNIQLFSPNREYGRVYYIKIYEWTTIIRDFIPCYRKSDNIIWLYDIVGKQFYTNSWTWVFTKWPNV